jgi:hypothetical protein
MVRPTSAAIAKRTALRPVERALAIGYTKTVRNRTVLRQSVVQ